MTTRDLTPEEAGTALMFLRRGLVGETDPTILARARRACEVLEAIALDR